MKLSYLLPFDNFKIETNLTVDEVKWRLADNIEPRKFRFSLFSEKKTKFYEGKIRGNSFQIRRIIYHNNAMLPIIKGNISTYLDKTEISIKMKPANSGLIFMYLWLGLVGLICIWALIAVFRYFDQESLTAMFIPFILFAFGFGLTTFGYRTEAEKSKAFLKKLLQAN